MRVPIASLLVISPRHTLVFWAPVVVVAFFFFLEIQELLGVKCMEALHGQRGSFEPKGEEGYQVLNL